MDSKISGVEFFGISWGAGKVVVDQDQEPKRKMGPFGVIREKEERMIMEAVRDEELEKQEERRVLREKDSFKWEKFLPVTGVRVLLVESDDSTRQIIAALLNNCNYKVIAISDGLEAWKILKRRHSNIDLVLMEVDIPSISGYALLNLIMEHNGCKNIPVVMMSSGGSMDTVFKCMSNGASDFLTKPLRKNELKNLWQHVWRKLTTVKTGNEPQDLNSGQCKAEATLGNHAAISPYIGSSDNASANKKRRINEKPTHVQGLASQRHTDLSHKKMKPHHEKNAEQKESSDVGAGRKAYIPGSPRPKKGKSCSGRMAMDDSEAPAERCEAAIAGCALPKPSRVAIDFIGRIDDQQRCISGESNSDLEMSGLSFEPQLELSLRGFVDKENHEMEETAVLNQSDGSAISEYSNRKLGSHLPSSPSICTEEVNGGEYEMGTELTPSESIPSMGGFRSKTTNIVGQLPYAGAEAFPRFGQSFVPLSFRGICVGYDAISPPTYGSQVLPASDNPTFSSQKESSSFSSSSSLQSEPSTLSSTPGCSQYNQGNTNLFTGEQALLEHKAFGSLEIHHSSICNGLTGHQPNSSSWYRTMPEGTKESGTLGTAVKQAGVEESMEGDGTDRDALRHDRMEGVNTHHSAQREAALAKFRLKRKDRCYDKKVRYQSRKNLAEQRPRVKGQFVRQA